SLCGRAVRNWGIDCQLLSQPASVSPFFTSFLKVCLPAGPRFQRTPYHNGIPLKARVFELASSRKSVVERFVQVYQKLLDNIEMGTSLLMPNGKFSLKKKLSDGFVNSILK
ncbi:MAG: hypothetical protein WBD56_14710, partial [Anaerolineales bacterium]